MDILSPEIGCESFEVNGLTYTRTDTLAVGRARLLQKFQVELQFDTTYRGLLDGVTQARADLNAGRLLDGMVAFGNLVEKLNLIGANRLREAEICGLFYNAPDEDPTRYDHAAFTDKVYSRWEGIDQDFFTYSALALLGRTSTRYPQAPAPAPLPSPPTDAP